VDRQARLRDAYAQVYAAGEELLKALSGPVTPGAVDQVANLVKQRDTAVSAAAGLFRPGDQELFGEQLQVLLRQQQALDAAMHQFLHDLAAISQAAARMKTAVRDSRRVMDPGTSGRILDQRR